MTLRKHGTPEGEIKSESKEAVTAAVKDNQKEGEHGSVSGEADSRSSDGKAGNSESQE